MYTINDIFAMLNNLKEKTDMTDISAFIIFIKDNINNLNEDEGIKCMLRKQLEEAALDTAHNITCRIMAMVDC